MRQTNIKVTHPGSVFQPFFLGGTLKIICYIQRNHCVLKYFRSEKLISERSTVALKLILRPFIFKSCHMRKPAYVVRRNWIIFLSLWGIFRIFRYFQISKFVFIFSIIFHMTVKYFFCEILVEKRYTTNSFKYANDKKRSTFLTQLKCGVTDTYGTKTVKFWSGGKRVPY
jgi:hypothetical protein